MKKLILTLSVVVGLCSFNLIAGEGDCPNSKGDCPKKENCENAKKDGGCCKDKKDCGKKKGGQDA